MTTSKFVRIDPNILLEYIYDDGNLISEEYAIISNSNTLVNSFISTLSSTNNYISTQTILVNNVSVDKLFTNQLVKLDSSQGQYGRLDFDTYSFVQKRDYGISIPIRYDKIRIWVPINYTFENFKGFHLRVFSLDFNNQNFVDLSNYFFNQSDINQYTEMQFSSDVLIQQEVPWGKYIELQFPSVTKVADQRVNNITRDNTINYNLTNGVGLSKDAPIFVDFFFIDSVQIVNNNTFYNLVQKRSVSFPQKPEFEKFGVVVEPSTQGDFFLIYPILNGSIVEFNQFIDESITFGNRYYLKFQIDVYEKNILTSTQNIIITEDFIEELEFRPILKYTTTTAIIDVTCSLIDAVDGSQIDRIASYAMLQDEVSNYSKYLSKIDLVKAEPVNVYKIKGISTPNLDAHNPNTVQTNLMIQKVPFVVYSRGYNIVLDNINANYLNTTWLGNRQLSVNLFPYNNVLIFNIISPDSSKEYIPTDLSIYTNLNLVFRSDKKKMAFDVYQDSDQNNLTSGSVVFKINQDKYSEIKKIFLSNFNSFYITGTTSDGTNQIIYTGLYSPWDTQSNISKLDNSFNSNQNKVVVKKKTPVSQTETKKINGIKDLLKLKLTTPTSTNTTGVKTAQAQNLNLNPNISVELTLSSLENQVSLAWKAYWKSPVDVNMTYKVMVKSYNYQFGSNLTDQTNKYKRPTDIRSFAISLKSNGIISTISVDKTTGQLSLATKAQIELILGYFKIYNFNPVDVDIVTYIAQNMDDLNAYLNSQFAKTESSLIAGSNVPPSKTVYDLVDKYITIELELSVNPQFTNYGKTNG